MTEQPHQRGTLTRIVEGGRLIWVLEWEFKGKTESRKGLAVERVLDDALRYLDEAAAPAGFSQPVFFTLKMPNLVRVWPADETFARAAREKLEEAARQERLAIEAARRQAEAAAAEARRERGAPFPQPASWRRTAKAESHFHNPYNFIPTPDGIPKAGNPLSHHAPCGHHAYQPDRFSGRLTVNLTVATPLIVGDTSREDRDDRGHVTVGVLEEGGRPVLPITSFKGVLRAAYEAVTVSRFGVFNTGEHGELPGRRMNASEGLGMIPARISDDGAALELWMGDHTPAAGPSWETKAPTWNPRARQGRGLWQAPNGEMYAAWLPTYDNRAGENTGGPNLASSRVRYPGGAEPQHGEAVVCWLRKVRKSNDKGEKVFEYWRVEDIRRGHDPAALPPQASQGLRRGGSHEYVVQKEIKAIGYVCLTGQNFSRKHDERVFFVPLSGGRRGADARIGAEQLQTWKARWKRLVEDYRAVAETTRKQQRKHGNGTYPDDAYLGKDPGKTAFSRHVYAPDALELGPGSLCYALMGRDGKQFVGLYPVMISRELGDFAPVEAVPDNILPAERMEDLSPADRVFGWVSQKGSSRGGRNMWRGQLRIAALDHVPVPGHQPIADFRKIDNGHGLPLAILSTPKPQQGRFYLGADRAGTPATEGPAHAAESFYTGNPGRKAIRGRKVYPHHRHAAGVSNYWNAVEAFARPAAPLKQDGVTCYREYVHPATDPRERRSDQNRSITGWVTPGTVFLAEIDVVNLSAAELGALVFLLTLPEGHFFRMGYAKPLGFGSVRAELAAVEIADGAALAADYLGPDGKGAAGGRRHDTVAALLEDGGPLEAFRSALSDLFAGRPDFEEIAVIRAFKTAAAGFPDRLPVHYPRAGQGDPVRPPVPPNPNGENFQWFGANVNETTGPHLALPPLWPPEGAAGPVGLPYLAKSAGRRG